MLKSLLVAFIVAIQCLKLNACGIAVHNEITYRSIENFVPKTPIQEIYKKDILESASYSQAGSFFPDWGYQCLGYNQQSEDAHWPTFIKTAVNYIREVYPVSRFHTDEHVKGLISFVFAIMSHGMADVKWHSLAGLSDYFIVAMANSDFHGDTKESHLAADAGAEFTLRHSSHLSYLNETWHVPVKDMIEIYKRLYSSGEQKVPLASHIQYCMTAAFAASKIDVEFGKLMFGYYGSKSPFLTEELYDYYKGGIQDMSASVTDCYPELINAFEHGTTRTEPDTLCASYFYTSLGNTSCLKHPKQHHTESQELIYKFYNHITGVFTITAKTGEKQTPDEDLSLPPIVQSGHHEERFRFQSPTDQPNKAKKCYPLQQGNGITLTIPLSSVRVGHQTISGDFNGNGKLDMAISAPYHNHATTQEQTGTVFILNNTVMMSLWEEDKHENDIRDVSTTVLQGAVNHGRFGWSMVTIDMNKDGIDDLAIATPFSNHQGMIEIYFGKANFGLCKNPGIRIQSQDLMASILAAIDVNQDGYKDLVIGCPLCSVKNQPQVGSVSIFYSKEQVSGVLTQADVVIENPNSESAAYDHFGESVLVVKDTILIGAPGYSMNPKQRVGRVYAFDMATKKLKWVISGTSEFQQFGRVLATDNNAIVAISSPSEETVIGLQKFWQGGSVRIYDWQRLDSKHDDIVTHLHMEHGMMSVIKGRTNAGHLGQSLSVFGHDQQQAGIWIGEPMSEQENGRVYRWQFGSEDIECIKNDQVLARFGSQINSFGADAICITSQRYGQNARYSGAVTFLQEALN